MKADTVRQRLRQAKDEHSRSDVDASSERQASTVDASANGARCLVEAAIIAPIAIALVFGAMETGYAYYGKLTVEHMSIAGARAGSGSANDYLSDYNTLQAVDDARTGDQASAITKIVIYRATGPGDRVPTACKTASGHQHVGHRGVQLLHRRRPVARRRRSSAASDHRVRTPRRTSTGARRPGSRRSWRRRATGRPTTSASTWSRRTRT